MTSPRSTIVLCMCLAAPLFGQLVVQNPQLDVSQTLQNVQNPGLPQLSGSSSLINPQSQAPQLLVTQGLRAFGTPGSAPLQTRLRGGAVLPGQTLRNLAQPLQTLQGFAQPSAGAAQALLEVREQRLAQVLAEVDAGLAMFTDPDGHTVALLHGAATPGTVLRVELSPQGSETRMVTGAISVATSLHIGRQQLAHFAGQADLLLQNIDGDSSFAVLPVQSSDARGAVLTQETSLSSAAISLIDADHDLQVSLAELEAVGSALTTVMSNHPAFPGALLEIARTGLLADTLHSRVSSLQSLGLATPPTSLGVLGGSNISSLPTNTSLHGLGLSALSATSSAQP